MKKLNRFILSLLIALTLCVPSYALNRVQLSTEYFPNPVASKALSNANIYVGNPDTDPEVVANRKSISALQENGTIVSIAQPVKTGLGGIPVYNGSPITILVDGQYSIKVTSSSGTQLYYVPVNYKTDESPVTPVSDISSLRATLSQTGDGEVVYISGHTSINDSGQGIFYWDADSVLADDNGTIIQVTGVAVGRWIRQLPGPYVTPEMFGCDSDESTVDNASFDAVLAYLAGQNGLCKMVLGPKKYRLTSWRVGTANQRIIVEGTSTKVESKSAATGGDIGTVIIIDGSVTTVGITLESAACGLKNITIYGDTGNTADGVQLLGNSTFLDTVTVTGMGGDGIVVNSPGLYLGTKVNTNNWLLTNVNARENTGNGVVIDSYHLNAGGGVVGPDANGGTAMHLNCQLNGGDGLVVGHCSVNNFYGVKTEGNGGYGVNLAGKGYSQLPYVAAGSFSGGNTFHNLHSESNHSGDAGYQFYCGQYAVSNLIYGSTQYAIYDDGNNIVNTIYGSSTTKNVYYGTDNFTINSIDAGQSTDTVPYTASNPNAIIKGASPGITMKETDAGADAKTWALRAGSGALSLRVVNDAGVAGDYVFDVTRNGNTITKTTFPDGKAIFTDGIGVGNGATASSLGPLTHVAPVVNAAGVLLGYIPIYGSYTP